MRATITLRNERGQEVLTHFADLRFGETLHITGIEVREKITIEGRLPKMDTVIWLDGTLEVKVEK